MAWYMDPLYFDKPQVSHTIKRDRQFYRDQADVGPGHFALIDPDAPDLVDVTWFWSDSQLSLFRNTWQNSDKLAFGGNWFEIDLVIGTGTDGNQNTGTTEKRYRCHFMRPVTQRISGANYWLVSSSLEVSGEIGTVFGNP